MTGKKIDHVILTRFNVPTPGRESLIRAQNGWLSSRIELFEKYCLPSVMAQTNRNFEWIIYFDPESPQWFMDWIDRVSVGQQFHPMFRTSISRSEMLADISLVTGATADMLLTTNLDNDDGLAVDFVQRLQGAVSGRRRQAIYLTRGIILHGHNTYLRVDRANAFCSVVEPWDAPVMAWAEWHNRLGKTMPVRELGGPPAWLQVIHGNNVSNTVHGRLVQPAEHADRLTYALAGLRPTPPTRLLIDAWLRRPVRVLRSSTRGMVKFVLLSLVGPTNFVELKSQVARLGHRLGTVATPDDGIRPVSPSNPAKADDSHAAL